LLRSAPLLRRSQPHFRFSRVAWEWSGFSLGEESEKLWLPGKQLKRFFPLGRCESCLFL
jgi:hypothetical protein